MEHECLYFSTKVWFQHSSENHFSTQSAQFSGVPGNQASSEATTETSAWDQYYYNHELDFHESDYHASPSVYLLALYHKQYKYSSHANFWGGSTAAALKVESWKACIN
jgi:hypothetical protein